MVVFEDVEESGRLYLNTALNSQAMQDGVKQMFPVFPSMLRPVAYSNPEAMQETYSVALTPHLNTDSKGGPAYLLKSVLKETKSTNSRLPMLGRRISKGIVRWGSTNLKMKTSTIDSYFKRKAPDSLEQENRDTEEQQAPKV